MQATATTPSVPDSPPFSDSSKKKTSNNSSKRAKASVACHECRKRKVKCEGIQPCSRCLKAKYKCVFPQQQSKARGPPKQYIEILEARLQLMEKALRMIGGPAKEILDDALSLDLHGSQDRNSIYEDDTTIQQANEYRSSSVQQLSDQFSINEIGQPNYTQLIYQQSTGSSLHHHHSIPSSDANDTIEVEPTTPLPSRPHRLADIDTSLLDLYFDHVHPYTPMIQKSTFNLQFAAMANTTSPTSSFMMLVFAMCAVAARWSSSQPTQPNAPPGFSYYQRAFAFFDEANACPCVTTIQALILLIKYQEQYKRAGYFYRPGYYLTIATDMCYSLKLHSQVVSDGDMNRTDPFEYEAKKRTFWMTFLYDLWISIEEGRETRFNNSQCSTDYPSLIDGSGDDDDELMTRHNVVIRLARTLSDIYGFSRRLGSRQQIQGTVRTSNQQIEEEGRLLVMQTTLETYLRDISCTPSFDFTPSTTEIGKYPANPGAALPNAFTGFLHMMYHYAIILLHRHHVLYPITNQNDNEGIHPAPFPHQQLCATSASIINIIAESILESSATLDVFHYPTRGVQFTILCVTMAIAVHKFEMETAQDEHRKSTANTLYWQALSIINKLATETPAVEITYLVKDAELAEMYGKLAMDNNNIISPSLQPLSTGSNTAYNNDTSSSTSSSPILNSSVLSNSTGSATDKINRSTQLAKSRCGTASGPPIRRFPQQMMSSDTTASPGTAMPTSPTSSNSSTSPSSSPTSCAPLSSGQQQSPHGLSSTINPAVLFNSSASITNPARLASLMQFGNIPTTSYNHHQQPIQVPATLNSTSMQQSSQRHASRSLHHYSQSQEDLRSLNQQHMNNKAGYIRAAEPGGLPQGRLKKHRSMKFLPSRSQQLQNTVQQHPPSSLQMQQLSSSQYQQHIHQQPFQQHLSGYQTPMQMPPQSHHNHIISNSMPYQQQQQQQMNSSMMFGPTINRRHTISFADMDSSSFISPTTSSLDYSSPASSSSMMQVDTTTVKSNLLDLHQHRHPPPTMLSTTNSQSIPFTSAYTPMMMENGPQMMMVDPGATTMGFADAWRQSALDMDRKTKGQALQ